MNTNLEQNLVIGIIFILKPVENVIALIKKGVVGLVSFPGNPNDSQNIEGAHSVKIVAIEIKIAIVVAGFSSKRHMGNNFNIERTGDK